ncbi:acyl carrier protein [compost metagenome]
MNPRDIIADYVRELTNESEIEDTSNLFELGLLTSLDVLDLLAFIEKTFDLEISEEDVDMESFGTIFGMAKLVEAKQGIGAKK